MTMEPSYLAMRGILKDKELRNYQCLDVIKCWLLQENLITYDTGMGKTVVASAVLRGLVNEVPSRRFIFVVGNNQFLSTPQEVAEDTGLKVETCTGQSKEQYEKIISGELRDYQVLFLSYTFFDNIEAVWHLYNNLHLFYGVVLDEAHILSNFTQANRAYVVRAFIRNFKFKLALTATPATRESKQFAELLHIVFPDKVTHVDEYARQMSAGKLNAYEDLDGHLINGKREGLVNFQVNTHIVEPMPGQEEAKGPRAPIIIKGPGSENQYQKLKEVLLGHLKLERNGLVYIRNRIVISWVAERLEEDGIRVGVLNGEILDPAKRGDVIRRFRTGEIDILLTSITTSIGMESDFLVLYQSCPDIVQMLGRGNRTMNPKDIHLDFIFTRGTREISYFLEETYSRSLELQLILQKDYQVLIKAGKMLENNSKVESF